MMSRTCRAAAAALPLLLLLLSADAAPSAAAPADGLQLLGISPRHGSARGGELVTYMFAGVSSADFAPALGSTFLGHWPVGERSGLCAIAACFDFPDFRLEGRRQRRPLSRRRHGG